MICRKCRTVYPNDENSCPKCRTKRYRSQKPAVISGIVVFALITAVCGAYMYYDPDVSAVLSPSAPPSVVRFPDVTDEPPPGHTRPSQTAAASAKPKDIASILYEVNSAFADYSQRHQGSANFISMGGYLFDTQRDDYVSVDDLIAEDMLGGTYKDENVYLLYLKPRDISVYPEVDFGDENVLRAVMAMETLDGVSLFMDGQRGLIYRENYMSLLAAYDQDGGEVMTPGTGDEGFAEIMDAIESGSISRDDLDLRFVSHDERYAYVLASIKPDSAAMYGFILLRNETGGLELVSVYKGIDAANYVAFNAEFPDINPELIPELNVQQYYDGIIEDFEPYLAYLSENAILDSGLEPVTYAAGAEGFVYIRTALRAFFITDGSDGIRAEQINSPAEAAALMRALTNRPPLFILRME
jgi:hypothetical protein